MQGTVGYGTYRFYLSSPVDALDRNAVLGLFTWHDDPEFDHREVDVEFARWGGAADPTNAQYAVQPWDDPGHRLRFTQPGGNPASVHSFRWSAAAVAFESAAGLVPPAAPSDVIARWTYAGPVPQPGGENPRMNLWLFRGRAPSNGREVEAVVERVEFVPGI